MLSVRGRENETLNNDLESLMVCLLSDGEEHFELVLFTFLLSRQPFASETYLSKRCRLFVELSLSECAKAICKWF